MTVQLDPAASRSRRLPRTFLVLALFTVTAASVAAERGEQVMLANTVSSRARAPKPLIDTVVPTQIATATFAMG